MCIRDSNIIGQICNYFNRLPPVLFFRKVSQIQFQDILMYHCHLIPVVQRILQDGDQIAVNLHSADLPGGISQILGQSPYTRPYLNHKIILCYFCLLYTSRCV